MRSVQRVTVMVCGMVVAWVLLGDAPAWAIVVSDDPIAHEPTPPSDYDMVGVMLYKGSRGSSAVLIDPWHVLTARHVLNVGGLYNHSFELDLADGTHTYAITARFLHPAADLAVGRLDRPTGLPGHDLYRQSSEVGKVGILVGYGISGVGAPDKYTYPRGVKRYGENLINLIHTEGGVDYLVMDFDGPSQPGPLAPGTLGTSREVILADGDSGGPTFIDVGGELLVAGLHLSMLDYNDNDIVPDYGDLGFDLRISPLANWIDDQLSYHTLTLDVVNVSFGEVLFDPEPVDANELVFPNDVEITLTAVPGPCKDFDYWEVYDPNHPGDANYVAIDSNLTVTLLMSDDREVVARFKCGDGTIVLMPGLLVALGLTGLVSRRARRRG